MIKARPLFLVLLAFWAVDLFLLPQIPFFRWALDPILLLLIFLGFRLASGRFLWLIGLGMGLLRDLATAGLWGGFACAFALIGWILNSGRHLVEREDPLMQGIWAGILAGAGTLIYGIIVACADPFVGWNRWVWAALPVIMGINGACAVWLFPKLQKIVGS